MARSRLRFSLILVLVIALLSFARIAAAQDTTNTSVSIGVKAILQSGQPVQGDFSGASTASLYAFSGSAGDTVTVSMVQDANSDLDPFLVLLGPNGEVIASDDDSSTDVLFSALISNVQLPDDGTYLVLATSFVHIDEVLVETGSATSEPSNSQFTLTVTGNNPATNLSADQSAIKITPLALGDTLDGQSSAANPVGYYTISGKTGDVVSIFASSSDFDTILHVFGPEGDRIAVNDDDAQGGTTNSAIRDFTLPEDGTYLIFATDVFFYNADTSNATPEFVGGKYTIHAE